MSCAFGRLMAIGCGCVSRTAARACAICPVWWPKAAVMVEPLKSKEYFDRVFVELGAPTWPNGFDLDPINLYMQLRDAGALSREAAE
jgi:hypothetical protein